MLVRAMWVQNAVGWRRAAGGIAGHSRKKGKAQLNRPGG